MRKAITILATFCLALGLASPAHAVDTRDWTYRACARYSPILTNPANVCIKAVIFRHGNGSGYTVKSRRIYAYTENSGGNTPCGNAFEDFGTQVYNNGLRVWGINAQHDLILKNVQTSPDLVLANACDVTYLVDVSSLNVGITVGFDFKARFDGNPDKTDYIGVNLRDDGSWGCIADSTECSRSLA